MLFARFNFILFYTLITDNW